MTEQEVLIKKGMTTYTFDMGDSWIAAVVLWSEKDALFSFGCASSSGTMKGIAIRFPNMCPAVPTALFQWTSWSPDSFALSSTTRIPAGMKIRYYSNTTSPQTSIIDCSFSTWFDHFVMLLRWTWKSDCSEISCPCWKRGTEYKKKLHQSIILIHLSKVSSIFIKWNSIIHSLEIFFEIPKKGRQTLLLHDFNLIGYTDKAFDTKADNISITSLWKKYSPIALMDRHT